ncbi:hypothetical protein AB0958_34995 [Streptomyces sp. NPDC006655]|uniref:hypothetical protein n=1 Tax=Streptomyces sp. NPDC006655 TaxID=3156898 RepID=UPI003453473A
MADEQYTWLNRETAERLLRGESLEAVDESARDQAECLAARLGALSARATAADTELPGEEAAVAAFRKARESAEEERTDAAWRPGAAGQGADAGLFRLGGAGRRPSRAPRWARPARLGLAAALAAGMLGGVAVAAGTGVLRTPFDDNRPGPAASVSATASPQRPQGSPSAESLLGGETGAPRTGTPSAGAGRSSAGASGRPKERDTGSAATPGNRWRGALASCRALRDGKPLGTGRRRSLEGFAGGSGRVDAFCRTVLGGRTDGDGDGNGVGGDDRGNAGGRGGRSDGKGGGNGQGGDGDGRSGRGGGKGFGPGGGGGGGGNDPHQDGVTSPVPTGFAPLAPDQPVSLPAPTYSAL